MTHLSRVVRQSVLKLFMAQACLANYVQPLSSNCPLFTQLLLNQALLIRIYLANLCLVRFFLSNLNSAKLCLARLCSTSLYMASFYTTSLYSTSFYFFNFYSTSLCLAILRSSMCAYIMLHLLSYKYVLFIFYKLGKFF